MYKKTANLIKFTENNQIFVANGIVPFGVNVKLIYSFGGAIFFINFMEKLWSAFYMVM